MSSFFAYDITRLATRLLSQTPNGIDRVDHAFAQHFLQENKESAGCLMSFAGPRLFSNDAARAAVKTIDAHWGEEEQSTGDAAYRKVLDRLDGRDAAPARGPISRKRSGQTKAMWRWMRTYGLPLGEPLSKRLPEGATYINVSQFPLWISSYFGWLKQRPDVKAVFFIHDLLPIERPEFFRPVEQAIHKKRLVNLAAFGTAAITSTDVVKDKLARYLSGLGRPGMPIFAAPLPVAPVFCKRAEVDPRLAQHRYFICCGTIEPRKNHLLLMHVWTELARRFGKDTPKLLLIGHRGWENENTRDFLERSILLRDHVIEISGLSTPGLKRLLDGAQALLIPSFDEGYGLPIGEALAAGIPVIASDIAVFREIGGERITRHSPIAGDRWLDTISAITQEALNGRQRPLLAPGPLITGSSYFAEIETFLSGLSQHR